MHDDGTAVQSATIIFKFSMILTSSKVNPPTLDILPQNARSTTSFPNP